MRKATPAVGRAGIEYLPVEFLILETGEGNEQPPVAVDGNVGPRVWSPVEIEGLGIDGDGS